MLLLPTTDPPMRAGGLLVSHIFHMQEEKKNTLRHWSQCSKETLNKHKQLESCCEFVIYLLLCVCLTWSWSSLITIHSSFCTLHILLEFAFIFALMTNFLTIIHFPVLKKMCFSSWYFSNFLKRAKAASRIVLVWQHAVEATALSHSTWSHNRTHVAWQVSLATLLGLDPSKTTSLTAEKKRKTTREKAACWNGFIFKHLPFCFLMSEQWKQWHVCMNV